MANLPSLESIEKSIEVLKAEKWPNFESFKSIDEFKKYFAFKFKQHFNHSFLALSNIRESNDLELKFFRARPADEIMDIHSINEYSYPPKELAKKNRANLPGYPVFYASNNLSTALLETIRNNHPETKERKYCVSVWTLKESKGLIITPFLYGNIQDEDYEMLSETILRHKLPEVLKNTDYRNDIESFQKVINYFSDSFINDDEKNYSIASFIGHSHIYMPNKLRTDILIYPSIQANKKNVNFAINPITVDTHMEMKYLLILQADSISLNENKIQFSTLNYGVCESNRIKIMPVGTSDENLDPNYIDILKFFKNSTL